MGLPLDLHFTDAAAPLFIEVEGDCFDSLFVISTSLVPWKKEQEQAVFRLLGICEVLAPVVMVYYAVESWRVYL